MIILKNWYTTCAGKYLAGNAYGHPRFEEGKFLHTTRIINIQDRIVTTKSGSEYCLEECGLNEEQELELINNWLNSQVIEEYNEL